MLLNFDQSAEVFYKGQMRILDIHSIWPQQTPWKILFHKINFWHVFLFWILLLDVIFCIYMIQNINQMNELIKALFMFATCSAYTLKIISLKYKSEQFLQLFANLHAAHFCPQTAEEKEIFVAATESSRKVRNFYGYLSLAALLGILLIGCATDRDLPVPTYNPLDDTYGSFGYWIMFIYQCGAIGGTCFCNIAFDSLCCSLFIFVRSQLDILALRLQRIGYNYNGEKEQELNINKELKNCIEYHKQIDELAVDIEKLISKPVSAQIFCSVLVLTANFYALSLLSDEIFVFVKYFIYQSAMLIQVFIICYYAGEITQRSYELPHEVYKSNWVHWTRVNRKLLLMLMQRLDIGVRIRSIVANHAFDLQLFSSIVNCSYSYFALLKRVNS